MAYSLLETDLHIAGNLSAKSYTAPAGSINNTAISATAAIASTKLIHRRHITYWQESATTAADGAFPVFSCYGATATIVALEAGSVVANIGDSTVTVDLTLDGSSVVSSVITLDNAEVAYTPKAVSGFSATAVTDGQLLQFDINATVGTGTLALGLFVTLIVDEVATP